MELSLNAPALLFPTISMLMLAYTNRFLAIASLVRNLHRQYNEAQDPRLLEQIRNLRLRLSLIQNMQATCVLCIFFSVVCMFLIFENQVTIAVWMFGLSLFLLLISLTLSLIEIYLSTIALRIELSDIEEKVRLEVFSFLRRKSVSEQQEENEI
ncbi:MAG: DUF2721 domain-containing protein [Verrucomicrobia bacterium]|nr:DUF2721 domain-containing protein [Cytophagales bacterium]